MLRKAILLESNHSSESIHLDFSITLTVQKFYLQKFNYSSAFIVLFLNRWKMPDNEFRKSEFKLTGIPTLLQYNSVSI